MQTTSKNFNLFGFNKKCYFYTLIFHSNHALMKPIFGILLSLFSILPILSIGQRRDSVVQVLQPIHKNVIKLDPTPMLLWSMKNVTISYERILNPSQSITLSIGYLEFPSLFGDTILNLVKITSRKKSGINIAMEYRFYLMKRNARPIPDGIYIAPFVSFYGYQFKNGIDVLHTSIDSAGMINGKIFVLNAGAEMGYQFVFWKRLTLDFVLIGPAVSYYGGSVGISGNISVDKIKNLHEDLYNRLVEKYPLVSGYVVNRSFSGNGKVDLFSIGFRYLIQIGFHF